MIFGPSKLPELGKTAGQTAKSFSDAAKEFNEELKKGMEVPFVLLSHMTCFANETYSDRETL